MAIKKDEGKSRVAVHHVFGNPAVIGEFEDITVEVTDDSTDVAYNYAVKLLDKINADRPPKQDIKLQKRASAAIEDK